MFTRLYWGVIVKSSKMLFIFEDQNKMVYQIIIFLKQILYLQPE